MDKSNRKRTKGGAEKERGQKIKKLSDKCVLTDEILYYKGGIFGTKLYVPDNLRMEVMIAHHDAPQSGHFGVNTTVYKISKRYNWPGMTNDVKKYVESCVKCMTRNKDPKMKRRQMVIDHEVFPKLFDTLIIDVYGKLKTTKNGNKFIVTCIDPYTRWVEGFCVPDVEASTIAKLLVNNILLKHGPIRVLQSDRGTNFLSELIKEICKLFKINKLDTAAYHPESNAKLERVHQNFNNIY